MTGDLLPALAAGLPWTLVVTALSFLSGAVLGLGLCMLRLSRVPLLRGLAGLSVLIIRAVPPLLWLLLLAAGARSAGLGLAPLATSVLGLGLVAAADMADLYRGALASVRGGEWEAATALGLPLRSRLRDVAAPRLMRVAARPAAAVAARLLRDSTIASLIGAGGIAAEADRAARAGAVPLTAFAAAGALYLALTLPVTAAARRAALRLPARAAP